MADERPEPQDSPEYPARVPPVRFKPLPWMLESGETAYSSSPCMMHEDLDTEEIDS